MKDLKTRDRGKQFGSLVRKAIDTSERYNIEGVAAGIDMSYQSFYQRLQGKTPFSADEIRRLIAFFPDPSLVSYLLKGTSYVAAERIEPGSDSHEDHIFKAAHRIVFEASDVLEVIDQALKDQRIDHRERATIMQEIDEAERSLLSLREFVSSMHK
ncbi:phage regulatory CII family protein [uncultured Cohaesibacter sp.]|uniref:phage regulatory CII family protein n=1 Tax=uncultured Cohaesibacter sp. TaxID=1002546 RepID=UPI00292D0D1C|nr:phage regulatory CII family protein [uncultured Cohaesibacter sp.]